MDETHNDGTNHRELENDQLADYKPVNGSSRPGKRSWIPLIAGTTMAVVGLSRKSKSGVALAAAGGALAYLGSRPTQLEQQSVAHGSVLINCSPEEAYARYSQFEDLPSFMKHLESVTKTGERQYRWVALGPVGTKIQWDAQVVDMRPGEFISWRSVPGSELEVEGFVSFRRAPGKRGTLLTAFTRYEHPGGKLGRSVAKLLGKDPSFLMQQDLRRLKALIETGEIPTIEGQSHGPRTRLTAAARMVNPDRRMRPDSEPSEVFEANRRIA